MNERISIATKAPDTKSQNLIPKIRRKANSSQLMNSPVDRILYLQRTIGNQAVQRLIKSGALQAKLRIGQPGDIYEQEADRVAEHVMRMPDVSEAKDARIQRKCPKCLKGPRGLLGKDKKEEKLQTKEAHGKTPEVTPQIEANINALKGGGQPLPESTRAFFEPRFGHDFSDVRVHTDAKAAESARMVNALAYTVGCDVVFGAGQYAPETNEGKRLMAHELTHTTQQSSSNLIQCVAAGAKTPTSPVSPSPTAPTCGPGTEDPFCLGIPGPNEPCKPFASLDHALAVWGVLSEQIPLGTALFTSCGEIKPVWDTYFAATSTPFQFSNPSSCVVGAAKTDPEGSDVANRAAKSYFKDIVDNLPVTLRRVAPSAFSLPGRPVAELRLPLEDAIGPHGSYYLHPEIAYQQPSNAAANIAGAVGVSGEGSDVFGDDDRVIGGIVIIEVDAIDPTNGMMAGQVRWQPHVHVKDTVDFCPGNLGLPWQRQFTIPMSKLEAMGLTRDVPITIDYDLDVQQANFNVLPFIGPLPPTPRPTPKPTPTPKLTFPRSGPAKTTGSLLRIRAGPGLNFTALGLLGESGTPIHVITQKHGDAVDGNDIWDKIDRGFVSDRFVAFDTSP